MRNPLPIVLLLVCALGVSGCAANSQAAKPVLCPKLPPVPPALLEPPTTEQRLRALLLEPAPSATPR